MATQAKGQVTLRGRFPAGARVRLVKVRDERVLRSEGGKEVAAATVGDDGAVVFSSGVEVGSRYFVVGQVGGVPLEVRVRGNMAGDESAVLTQPPIVPERRRLSGGGFMDETPAREKAPAIELGPGLGQHQVPAGTVQRSDTPFGQATPVDLGAPGEPGPYPAQGDVSGGTVQRSDTEHGIATPIADVEPVDQRDAPDGLVQRSSTGLGVTTPIAKGDAVAAHTARESALGRATHGEPGKVAARPVEPRTQAKPRTASKAKSKKAAKAPAKKAAKPAARRKG